MAFAFNKRFIFCVFCFAAHLWMSSNAYSMGLHEAISETLKNNPKTNAKLHELKAMALQNQALEEKAWPSASLNCSQYYYNSKNRDWIHDSNYASRSQNSDCGIYFNYNLFDGGSLKYQAQAAKESEKAYRERINSTNFMIQDTKGLLISQTYKAYLQLIGTQIQLDHYIEKLKYVENLKTWIASSDDQKMWEQSHQNIQNMIQNLKEQMERHQSFFYYVVRVQPSNLEFPENLLNQLSIPQNDSAAYEEALLKNPDLKARQHELNAARLRLKSTEASLGPKLDASIARENIRYQDPALNSSLKTHQSSIEISLSLPLDASKYTYKQASEESVLSAEWTLESVKNDLKQNLFDDYQNMLSNANLYEKVKTQYQNSKSDLIDVIQNRQFSKIATSPKLKDVFDIYLIAFEMNFQEYFGRQFGLLDQKIKIQIDSGIIFDYIGKEYMQWVDIPEYLQ